MQVPVINGIYTDQQSDIRTSYPKNLIPVFQKSGISNGYLRPADGIVQFGVGPGADRGAINWNDICFRVMGEQLCKVAYDGTVTQLGSVGTGGQVTLDYSFDRLAIASGGRLYYYDGTTLTQVTDPDLGTVVDVVWVDGYFMTTDGTSLVVTELTDPFAVNPLKYGSSEIDPDPVVGLLKLRDEIYALNRYTIESFQNVGGALFPFQRIEGAQIERGAVGTHSSAVFMESIVFLGGGRNEAISLWLGRNGSSVKISTREIDEIIEGYTALVLADVLLERKIEKDHEFLYVHLPDQTLVYDGMASQAAGEHIWSIRTSGLIGLSQYKARNIVRCYNKWISADPGSFNIGYFDDSVSSHYGEVIGWEFGTLIMYSEGKGAVFHELELVCVTGRAAFGDDPTIWTSYSLDGVTWSQERSRTAGKFGQRLKRLAWLRQGMMSHFRVQKFRGTSDAHLSVARLEAQIEPLYV